MEYTEYFYFYNSVHLTETKIDKLSLKNHYDIFGRYIGTMNLFRNLILTVALLIIKSHLGKLYANIFMLLLF